MFDGGGDTNLTEGWKVNDIENVVLTQVNGVPVQVKDVAKVYVGYVPRLGIAGKDQDDDVALSIVVMSRTFHTNDVVPRIKAEVERINSDGTLPPGVKLVPYYDRASLVAVTTHTVLHNLIFGCLLVFLIQWIFLGDLRSAIIVGANIPFALFFSVIILVLLGQDANLLSVGAVDFGIIVDSAVILVENIFRNFQAPPGSSGRRRSNSLPRNVWRDRPDQDEDTATSSLWTDRLRLILVSALQVDKAIFFSAAITVAAFVPLFTMQGVEGQIFKPDGADLWLCPRRRVARDLHDHAGARLALCCRSTSAKPRPSWCACCAPSMSRSCTGRSTIARPCSRSASRSWP